MHPTFLKFIACILLLAMLIPSFSAVVKPKPAGALFGFLDQVFNFAINPATFIPLLKDMVKTFVLDPLISLVSTRILDNLKRAFIKWVEDGGTPRFVTDWQGFLREAVLDVLTDELNDALGGRLCAPFVSVVLPALNTRKTRTRDIAEQSRCTLDDVIANIQNPVAFSFVDPDYSARNPRLWYLDFENGGFKAFAAASRWQNRAESVITMDLSLTEEEANSSLAGDTLEVLANAGFRGSKDAITGLISTPGTFIQSMTSSYFRSTAITKLENADSIGEVFSAIAFGVLGNLIRPDGGLVKPKAKSPTARASDPEISLTAVEELDVWIDAKLALIPLIDGFLQTLSSSDVHSPINDYLDSIDATCGGTGQDPCKFKPAEALRMDMSNNQTIALINVILTAARDAFGNRGYQWRSDATSADGVLEKSILLGKCIDYRTTQFGSSVTIIHQTSKSVYTFMDKNSALAHAQDAIEKLDEYSTRLYKIRGPNPLVTGLLSSTLAFLCTLFPTASYCNAAAAFEPETVVCRNQTGQAVTISGTRTALTPGETCPSGSVVDFGTRDNADPACGQGSSGVACENQPRTANERIRSAELKRLKELTELNALTFLKNAVLETTGEADLLREYAKQLEEDLQTASAANADSIIQAIANAKETREDIVEPLVEDVYNAMDGFRSAAASDKQMLASQGDLKSTLEEENVLMGQMASACIGWVPDFGLNQAGCSATTPFPQNVSGCYAPRDLDTALPSTYPGVNDETHYGHDEGDDEHKSDKIQQYR